MRGVEDLGLAPTPSVAPAPALPRGGGYTGAPRPPTNLASCPCKFPIRA